jgi:threonine 3-dehydrogenase
MKALTSMWRRSSTRSAMPCTRRCQFDLLGEDVLITGAGPIGIMAAAIVRQAGARYVVITDMNEFRLDWRKRMGVDLAVNVKEKRLRDVQRTRHDRGLRRGP